MLNWEQTMHSAIVGEEGGAALPIGGDGGMFNC